MPVFSLFLQPAKATTRQDGPPDKDLPDLEILRKIQNPASKAPDPIPSIQANCSPYDPFCGSLMHANAATNPPPTVNITAPLNGAAIVAGGIVTLAADAIDSNGYVKWVDFYSTVNGGSGVYLGRSYKVTPATGKWEYSTTFSSGNYLLRAVATDNLNATGTSANVSITVSGGDSSNHPPTANPGGPYAGIINTVINFIGSGMDTDVGDFIINYDWNFGDGTAHGSGATVSHAYATSGTFTVTLVVTDNHGATGSGSTTVTVSTSGTRVPFNGPHNMPGRIEAEDFDGGGQNLTYFDSTAGNAWGAYRATDVDIEPVGATGYHIGNAVAGEWLEYSFTLAQSGTFDIRTNLAIPFSGGQFHISIDNINVTGTLTIQQPTGGWASYQNITKTNVSLGAGAHILRLTLDTNATGVNAVANINWLEITNSAGNLPPTANPGGPYSGTINNAVSFTGSGSDPDTGDFIQSYSWNFGDGTAPSTQANPSHVYNAVGNYTVVLTVTDSHGAQGSASTTANITAPAPPPTGDNYSIARIDLNNRTGEPGEDLLSRNYNFNISLLSLKGRSGLHLGLSLTYNSLVWVRSGNVMKFNADNGYPGPGFRLGFPVIQQPYLNTSIGNGINAYLLITPSGHRVELRQVNPGSNLYESADSSYLQYNDVTRVLLSPDGSQMKYGQYGNEFRCTEIKDRNGNYLTASYLDSGRLNSIIDTLGRVVTFTYDGNQNLQSITQVWNGQTHVWATFGYGNITLQTNFAGLTIEGPPNGASLNLLTQVGLADGSRYVFDYTTWGQVNKISNYAADNHLLNYVSYDLPANASVALSDCPSFTQRTDWAENWQGSAAVITAYTFAANRAFGQKITPDGTVYKENFFTTTYQRGLLDSSQITSGGQVKKTTAITWTQDNPALAYKLNPRPLETNVYDGTSSSYTNRRRTAFSYTSFGLPSDVTEYDANGATVLRRTHTDYDLSVTYINSMIRNIGLPTFQSLYDGNNTLFSKIEYQYDLSGYLEALPNPATNHQNPNYTGRGNLCLTRRFDVTDPQNSAKAVSNFIGYNTTGSITFTRDGVNHQASISYTDLYSDNINHNTFAYPTRLSDAGGFSSNLTYHFDMGVETRSQDPKGAVVTKNYDSAGRLERIERLDPGSGNLAYTRWVYPASLNLINTFTIVEAQLGEAFSTQIFDGAGRVRESASEFPNSQGGFRGVSIVYDVMGRMTSQSNPTEINGTWTPVGDDASWIFAQQIYDWNGRPTVSTNQDGKSRSVSYSTCGCAGGDVLTLTDEANRRQKIYQDSLGRVVKSESLNNDFSVYSTVTNTYNIRDQLIRVRQFQGSDTSNRYQDTDLTYDGHGRLKTRKSPVEASPMSFDYNADDTVQKRTDPRGAIASFTYNSRQLITAITFTKPVGIAMPDGPVTNPLAVPKATDVTFGYDEAGNRLWMNESQSSVTLARTDYTYNQLSQLLSETRTITGLGAFRLSYSYNLGGDLKTLTDPFNSIVTYVYNKTGEVTAINGSGYGGTTQLATAMQYRAWGELKHINRGGNNVDYGYKNSLLLSRYTFNGVHTDYQYFDDSQVKTSHLVNGNTEFDRAYQYDQMGRMIGGVSGGAAQDPPTTTIATPYNQTYQYDAFGNLTGRTNTLWNHQLNPLNATYVNDRNSAWTYDASGNVKTDTNGNVYTYNSAGQMTDWSLYPNSISQIYDGDELPSKRFETRQDPVFSSTIYLIRSTVLDGKTIAELDGSGQRKTSFIYHQDEVLAKYQKPATDQPFQLDWVHITPITNDRLENGRSYTTDPLGGLIPGSDPYLKNPNPDYGNMLGNREGHLYDTDPFDAGTCVLDGAPFDCSQLQHLIEIGAVDAEALVGGQRRTTNITPLNRGFFVDILPPSNPLDIGDGAFHLGVSDLAPMRTLYFDDSFTAGTLSLRKILALSPAIKTSPHKPSLPCVTAALWATPMNFWNQAQTAISALLSESNAAGLTTAQKAYVLATAFHESRLGAMMNEIWGPTADQLRYEGSQQLGNTQAGDGYRLRGRGYVQITGRSNYEYWGVQLGKNIASNPDIVSNDPAIAAYITVWGMKGGTFTGRSLGTFVNKKRTDFYGARAVVNGDKKKNGRKIARYAQNYNRALTNCY
jgi:YD repeat-containing protein